MSALSLMVHRPTRSHAPRHPLVIFFTSTYAITWMLWTPLVVFRTDMPDGAGILLAVLGSLAPSSIALILTARWTGRQGLRELGNGLRMARIGLRWYVAVIALPLLVPLAVAVSVQLGGDVPPVDTTIVTVIVIFALSIFPGSALGEELGWRGLALPRMQANHTALSSSLIIGTLWGLWHLPLYLAGLDNRPLSVFPVFVLAVIASSVVCTWMYNSTGGSLLIVVLYHAAANLPLTVLLEPLGTRAVQPFIIYVGLTVLTAAAITVAAGPKHLSRTRTRQTITISAASSMTEARGEG